MTGVVHEEGRGPVFWQAIRAAASRVALWVLTALVLYGLSIGPAAFVHDFFEGAVSHRYEPGELLRSLDADFVTDHADERGALDDRLAILGAVAGLFAILFGAFAAGGWLQVFLERTEGHSVRRFLHGGSRHFWRFFRVLLLVIVGAAVIQRVVYHEPWHELVETRLLELPEVPAQDAETGPDYSSVRMEGLASELTARRVVWVQDGLHALLLALLLVWAVYTRTRLALHDASSSLWAGLCTFFTMLRHPILTLRPMLLILLVELAVVWAAGSVHEVMEGALGSESTAKSVALILALSAAVLCASEILHAARYHAAIGVSRRVIGPIARPDPWKHSIGAPGGPQYPIIEGGDEYGVSL